MDPLARALAILAVGLVVAAADCDARAAAPECSEVVAVKKPCRGLRGPSSVLRAWYRDSVEHLPVCRANLAECRKVAAADLKRCEDRAAAAAKKAAANLAACDAQVADLEKLKAAPPPAPPLWPYVVVGGAALVVGAVVGIVVGVAL